MGDDAVDLVGTTWRLERLAGADVDADDDEVRSTITFGPDGNVSGSGGVNRFFGGYGVAGDRVEFGQLAATLMAGPERAMEQEQRFLAVLGGTVGYAVDGDVLTLGDAVLRRVSQTVVSGTVTYRERMALPPGAVVVVSLLDVSRADAPAVTMAEQRIEVEHQVPIPFSLRIDADRFDPRYRYSVAARIEIDGRPAWMSDTHHPVTVDGVADLEIVVVRARS
jgi:putative lipoprotein